MTLYPSSQKPRHHMDGISRNGNQRSLYNWKVISVYWKISKSHHFNVFDENKGYQKTNQFTEMSLEQIWILRNIKILSENTSISENGHYLQFYHQDAHVTYFTKSSSLERGNPPRTGKILHSDYIAWQLHVSKSPNSWLLMKRQTYCCNLNPAFSTLRRPLNPPSLWLCIPGKLQSSLLLAT